MDVVNFLFLPRLWQTIQELRQLSILQERSRLCWFYTFTILRTIFETCWTLWKPLRHLSIWLQLQLGESAYRASWLRWKPLHLEAVFLLLDHNRLIGQEFIQIGKPSVGLFVPWERLAWSASDLHVVDFIKSYHLSVERSVGLKNLWL